MKSRPGQPPFSFEESPLLDNPIRPALKAGTAFFLILLLVDLLACWAVAQIVGPASDRWPEDWAIPVMIHLVTGAILGVISQCLAAIPSVYMALLVALLVTLPLVLILNFFIGFSLFWHFA